MERHALRGFLTRRAHLSVGAKFRAVLVVLIPLIAGLAWIGLTGLAETRLHTEAIYADVQTAQVAMDLRRSLEDAERSALRLASMTSPRARDRLVSEFETDIIPAVASNISDLAGRDEGHSGDAAELSSAAAEVEVEWREFLTFRRAQLLAGSVTPARRDALLRGTLNTFESMIAVTEEVASEEAEEAEDARAGAHAIYQRGRVLLLGGLALALVAGAGSVAGLTRSVVPRMKEYSMFAGRVATGAIEGHLTTRDRTSSRSLASP